MEDPNSTLLPYILETLSHKPELCDTFDNLCKDIEAQLALEENTKYGNIRNALQRALSVGQSLGIITLTNETIRVPFNFRANNKNAKAPANPNSSQVPQPTIGTGNPPPQEKIQKKSRKNMNHYDNRDDEDPEYMMVPPSHRSRPARMAARSRGRPRKTSARSRGRSTRGRARSGYGRRRTTRRR